MLLCCGLCQGTIKYSIYNISWIMTLWAHVKFIKLVYYMVELGKHTYWLVVL